MKDIELKYTITYDDALRFAEEGFTPIECSFGNKSVTAYGGLDHHGDVKHLPPVCLQALERIENEQADVSSRFVVTGSADADACFAILALSGKLNDMESEKRLALAEAIAHVDLDPIRYSPGIVIKEEASEEKVHAYESILLFNYKTKGIARGEEGFHAALDVMEDIAFERFSRQDYEEAIRSNEERIKLAETGIIAVGEGAVFASSPAWGFDVWYQKADTVMAYVEKTKAVTFGVVSKEVAQERYGEGGLSFLFDRLNEEGVLGGGFGGRESVGGSPRGVQIELGEALELFEKVDALCVDRTNQIAQEKRLAATEDRDHDR